MRKLCLIAVMLGVHACGQDFDPYNLVTGFRVLGVGADRPQLLPGETATIDALVRPAEGEAVSYAWSWCPFTTGSTDGYECALGRGAFQAQLDALLGDDSFEIPAYDLGSSPQASFDHVFTQEAVAGLCEALSAQLPEAAATSSVEVPTCAPGLPVSIRLEASSGDQAIVSVTNLELLADDSLSPNSPPVATGLRIARGAEASFGESQPMTTDFEVLAGEEYTLFVDIGAAESESYDQDGETLEEDLIFSWFFTDGEARFGRTAYLPLADPVIELETGRANRWVAPDNPGRVDFYVVVRDSRDALSWQDGAVRVQTP